MPSLSVQDRLGQVLVEFSTDGTFPEEETVAAAHLDSATVSAALNEVREISRESAPDVDLWIKHAKSIQDDIERSRRLASTIVLQAEADEKRLAGLAEKEDYVDFLAQELSFNDQLFSALSALQGANDSLNTAAKLASNERIIDALHMLEGNPTDINQAIIGLKAYKELDQAAKKLWEDLDEVILKPRTDLQIRSIPSIHVAGDSLSLGTEVADQTIKSLFIDLEVIIQFLIVNIPSELIQPLADQMMPQLSARILEVWLDTAVPASLGDMVDYQKALAQVGDFASKLENLGWPGAHSFNDWVTNAPKIWVNKRRETTLDWTRNQLSLGIGTPQIAERVEKQMVARDEGDHIVASGTAVSQDWDDAWSDDGEHASENGDNSPNQFSNGSTRHRKSLEEERRNTEVLSPLANPSTDESIDDSADGWGWGDDDDANDTAPVAGSPAAPDNSGGQVPIQRQITPLTREMTLSEKYWTSSLSRAVYTIVEQVYVDGAHLTKAENAHIPVSPAASGLFGLPTLILALYRAISPYYYSLEPAGNMYLYNDAMWLSERFHQFLSEWHSRDDISRRACGMVKIEPETKILVSFGKRAYTKELNTQRTVINDLLGGAQNFFQQDSATGGELEDGIKVVISHIRTTAALWKKILPYSAWASATGSLVNTIASKLIADVFDLSDISVDDAERMATILSRVESLDELFIPKPDATRSKSQSHLSQNETDDAVPLTSQFADQWMKMKFLSEVLQSNLKDVRFLWFESDLSLYFSVSEVVDLVHLSFEKNAAVRQVVRDIRENPDPRGEKA
ncbi:centromere kinetochore protein [Diplocarpon rosae]|nr:centromere kinetochore protein [Diplocarpon rosae]